MILHILLLAGGSVGGFIVRGFLNSRIANLEKELVGLYDQLDAALHKDEAALRADIEKAKLWLESKL